AAMTEELETLRDMTARLESAGIDYMLTGSVALNCYAQPRMTRDIDLVVAFFWRMRIGSTECSGRITMSPPKQPATPCCTGAASTPSTSAASQRSIS
ncbi:MAG: hypothetical protein PHC88_16950, partial [Terrimicrobiaceae bacterium]|nr:hypothetical protein [Terrimicrobiaceae bacterium]